MLNSGISVISDIGMNDLSGKYELVLLGHYHKPQELSGQNIKLFYVGSPIQLDWGEKEDEKRFLVVDTDTLDVQSIPTTGYKKYIEFKIDSSNKSEVLTAAKEAQEKGHHIKVLKTENVSIESDEFRIIDKTEKDVTNRGIDSSMSMEDKHRKYLDIKEVDKIEHDEYLKEAFEMLQECEVV
jgi:DNA repair exonuclease SbcCD nuclease subunit